MQLLVFDLLIILTTGLLAGLVCRKLNLSLLLGYLISGLLIGQGGFDWISDQHHEIEHIAEAGVILLLFAIGLELSLDELRQLGWNFVVGGALQMSLVFLPVSSLLLFSGQSWQSALLISAAAAFSSTVLVFRSLSEQGAISRAEGRRSIGILLFQDVALIPLLMLVPFLTGQGETTRLEQYLYIGCATVVFVLAILLARFVISGWVLPYLSRDWNPEVVVLFTLVILISITFCAYQMGLPPAIGAFSAGLVLSANRWTKQIDAIVLPFRESFAVVFFVSLGLLFDPMICIKEPIFLAFSLIALILIKWFAASTSLYITGLSSRASLGMGMGLAHVGEFAFVLLILGRNVGVISELDYQRIFTLAIGSLLLTPYLLSCGLRWSRSLESDHAFNTENQKNAYDNSISRAIVIGAGPIGRAVASRLETVGKQVTLIDLSAVNLYSFAQRGFHTIAGDATQVTTLQSAEVSEASLVIVSVPDDQSASRIVKNVRNLNSNCFLLVRCRFELNRQQLIKLGACEVVSEEAEASSAILMKLDHSVGYKRPPRVKSKRQ